MEFPILVCRMSLNADNFNLFTCTPALLQAVKNLMVEYCNLSDGKCGLTL